MNGLEIERKFLIKMPSLEALSALEESGEIDFSRNARLLLEKKLSDECDEEEAKKILFKNGFKIC